jgi:molybdopterin synthase catalytic subunit
MLKVTHDGSLQSALKDLYDDGMDFVVVEGFKMSDLPKVVLGDVQVARALKRVDLSQVNDDLIREIVNLVLGLEDFVPYIQDCSGKIS